MLKNKITIKEVAQMSGVSPRTVSRVINNLPSVHPETRKKVQQILNETGFETNIFAKNLRKREMKNILVIIEKQKGLYLGQWYTNLKEEIINNATPHKFYVISMEYDYKDDFEEFYGAKLLKTGFADGVILFNTRINDKKIKALKKMNVPFVLLGKDYQDIRTPFVDIDNEDGAYIATKYLIEKGLSDIVLMVGNTEYTVNYERINGFKRAFEEKGISIDLNSRVIENIKSFKDTYQIAKDFVQQGRLPEAMFISGDEKAIGAIKALGEEGIRIPEEVSIVGFDNIPISAYFNPSLSTVEQPAKEIAEKAFKILYSLISEDDSPKQALISPKLIIRDTTL